MAFRIEVTLAAEEDIADAVEFIAADSPERARKWFEDLFAALETLIESPLRHARIPESRDLKRSLRSFRHHSHRVVYEVREAGEVTYFVRVYHFARRPLSNKDV